MKKNYMTHLLASAALFTGSILGGQAQNISIDAAVLKQKVDAIGGDVERAQGFIPNAANPAEVMQWCFGDINFNVCRVAYDKKQEMTEGQKVLTTFYANTIQTMQWIKQANPNIKFLATMKSDYAGYNEGNHNNLPTFIYDYACTQEDANGNCTQSTGTLAFNATKYGIFLADYLQHMHLNGVTISYLATCKEWHSVVTPQRSHDTYLKVISECQLRGVPVPQLIGPASWGLPSAITYVNDTKTLGFQNDFYAFSSHNLGNHDTQYGNFVTAATNAGKPAWDDESGAGAGGPTFGVEVDINTTIDSYYKKTLHYAAGYTGEIMFELTSRGITRETRAVYFKSGETGKRMRGYYILKDFTNNVIGKNYVASTVSSLPGVYTMAFRNGNNMTLVVLNDSTQYTSVPLNLTGVNITSNITEKKWTNSDSTGVSSSFAKTDPDTFTRTLASNSISIFTFTVENGVIPTASIFFNNIGQANRIRYTNQSETPAQAYVEGTLATGTGSWVQWQFVDAGSGWYYIRSIGSNRRLQCTNTTIDGGVDGAVQVYLVPSSNTTDEVKWKLVDKGNGVFHLLNKAYPKHLQCTNVVGPTAGLKVRAVNNTLTAAWTQWTYTPVSGARFATEELATTAAAEGSFTVYPNPTKKDNITLALPGNETKTRLVRITDLSGRQVLSQSVSSPNAQVNVSKLASGMYVITVQQDKNILKQRLVIE